MLVAVTAGAAGVELGGCWDFRFEEGKSIEQAFAADFVTTDRMVVPGCFDTMPQWFMKKGTGLYRRVFTLTAPLSNAVLRVEGLGCAGLSALTDAISALTSCRGARWSLQSVRWRRGGMF